MNALAAWSQSVAGLAVDSIVLVLVVKWTVAFAVAWLAHAMLAGRNPRWRVALWRTTVIGIALMALLSSAPPIVEYRLTPVRPATVEAGRSVSIAPPGKDRAAREAVSRQDAIAANDPALASAPVVRTEGGTHPASISQRAEPVQSAPAQDPGAPRWAGARSWIGSIWLAGLFVLTVRLIVGSLGLARLVRRSSDVPHAIVRQSQAIAERLGCRRVVQVRRTSELSTPCLAGIVRPVLLLPERECQHARSDDLRAIPAHELAHARNHDLAWNLAAHVASILLWFHPLAWRIRAAHAAACDAVCDAVAVDLLGDVASYGRTLARLALRATWPAPVHGLAMARTSDVGLRIEALNRMVFQTPLSWRRVIPALCVASPLLVLIGGFGFTRAEQAGSGSPSEAAKVSPRSRAADEKATGKLTLRAVSAGTNEPIEGVSIEYWIRFGERIHEATIFTAEDGTATMEWAPRATVNTIGLTARAPKLVPINILWDDQHHPINLPETKELRFGPGTTIGGIVRDEAGHPIAGATVNVHGPPTETDRPNNAFTIGEVTTNAEGRWRIDVAPSDLSALWANVTCPHYRNNGMSVSRDLDSVVTLKKGLTVRGRVIDAAGQPIRGARAAIGPNTWGPNALSAISDERGDFILEN
jgi:beta-lactamase regulating signal transducer with metallopeptidase domain